MNDEIPNKIKLNQPNLMQPITSQPTSKYVPLCTQLRHRDFIFQFMFLFADGRRKRSLIEPAAGPFSPMLGGSPSKLMRYHDALLYQRRLADYCHPTFPLLTSQLRRPIQSYDPKPFPPATRPESPSIMDGNAAAGPPTVRVSAENQTLLSHGGDRVETDQSVSPPSMPLLGALFSYLHPSLAAATAAAMAHWYLGAGASSAVASRPPPTADPLLTQRGSGQVPEWAVRLRIEDLLRARSAAAAAAAAAMTSQTSSLTAGQYVGLADGPWNRHSATSVTEGVEHHRPASPDTSASSDVPFRPYLPDVRRPPLSTDQHRSPDVEPALNWDRSDAASCESKSSDHEAGSGDSVGRGSGVEVTDGRNSSDLVNMERMVHGLKHVQTAAIEELSKVADSY